MIYVATFHTQFAAQCFFRCTKKNNLEAKMMPVPRILSASCGVCVQFCYEGDVLSLIMEDLEGIYLYSNGIYSTIYMNE